MTEGRVPSSGSEHWRSHCRSWQHRGRVLGIDRWWEYPEIHHCYTEIKPWNPNQKNMMDKYKPFGERPEGKCHRRWQSSRRKGTGFRRWQAKCCPREEGTRSLWPPISTWIHSAREEVSDVEEEEEEEGDDGKCDKWSLHSFCLSSSFDYCFSSPSSPMQ